MISEGSCHADLFFFNFSFPFCCTPLISEWDNPSEHLMSSLFLILAQEFTNICIMLAIHLQVFNIWLFYHLQFQYCCYKVMYYSCNPGLNFQTCRLHTTIINIDFKAPRSIFSPSLKTQKKRHLYSAEHKIKSCIHMTQWDAKLEILDSCASTQWALAGMYWGLQAV